MPIKIIHQTKDYLILNKPSGISMHKDGKREEYTVADWLFENFPQVKGVGENLITSDGKEIEKPGIVHRLDKETSGIILVALNQKSYEHFKKQFKNKETQKVYYLFAYGNLKEDLITVDAPIGKDRKDFRKKTTKNPRGKIRESKTYFKVLNRGKDSGELYVFVEARPQTGRTHQIRVHMKHLNTPIVCDSLYAPKRKPILGFKRLALHAKTLIFKDLNGNEKTFEAEYFEDFQNSIKSLAIKGNA